MWTGLQVQWEWPLEGFVQQKLCFDIVSLHVCGGVHVCVFVCVCVCVRARAKVPSACKSAQVCMSSCVFTWVHTSLWLFTRPGV